MARAQKPPAGRLVISVAYASLDALSDSLKSLERRFGRVMKETGEMTFSEADQYREEMGSTLRRRFFAFDKPAYRDLLPEIKATCYKIESQFADRVRDDFFFRTVNIDPGILSLANLTMASHREFAHRVYLRDGVFAELALVHSRGQFVRLPWTPPDFVTEEAIRFFTQTHRDLARPAEHSDREMLVADTAR